MSACIISLVVLYGSINVRWVSVGVMYLPGHMVKTAFSGWIISSCVYLFIYWCVGVFVPRAICATLRSIVSVSITSLSCQRGNIMFEGECQHYVIAVLYGQYNACSVNVSKSLPYHMVKVTPSGWVSASYILPCRTVEIILKVSIISLVVPYGSIILNEWVSTLCPCRAIWATLCSVCECQHHVSIVSYGQHCAQKWVSVSCHLQCHMG